MIQNSLYHYYDGVGAGELSSSLPIQTLPDAKKNQDWKMATLDRLENIALHQISRNVEFRDYYKMVEGRLVYSDFEAPPEIVKDIAQLRQEMDLPTYLRHYDLIGVIANGMAGELDNNKDKLRVDSIDEYSQNEYTREKSRLLNDYMQQKFNLEIKRGMAMKGINPDEQRQFASEEEQQQYMQMLQQMADSIVPPEVKEKELSKNFKVKAAEWGDETYKADVTRFGMDFMEEKEFMDYFLTGRYFRHYHVGYDFYKPERWAVETTFFSEELDIKYPQDGEYVGRLLWVSASELISRYGHKLSEKLQRKIGQVYDHTTEMQEDARADVTKLAGMRAARSTTVPHVDYYNHQLHVQLQEAFGTPAGISTFVDENGVEQHAPDWLSDYEGNQNWFGSTYAQELRDDIAVRRDLFRVTEAYWRSFKRMGYLRYLSPSGVVVEELVDDTLLSDFLKENNIKKMRNISLEDFESGDDINVIAYFYVPEIWKGKKIHAGNGWLSDDIYFDIAPLDFQIKGESNIFDVKLPVAGIITSSQARRIRPYQMGYNICMNQIFNLLEKEIGMFFLMDINFLPSEFKDMGDSAELLEELRGMARDFGFLPVDTSRQNLQGQNPQAGYFQKQDISYDAQINRRMVMAEMYKRLALEQIGITDQRKGSPDQYSTAEGIRVGQEASYAQTRLIYSDFNEARRKAVELHLNVAQFCAGEGKDISVFARKSDGDIALLEFTDELFPLRTLGITAITDAKSRKSLENLRQVLLQNNTAGSDILDFAEIMASDTMGELISIGKRNRRRQDEMVQAEREQEQALVQQQIEGAKEEAAAQREYDSFQEQAERDKDIQVAEIQALGRASDKQSDVTGIENIREAADQALKEKQVDADIEGKNEDRKIKREGQRATYALKQEELRLKLAELRERREQRKSEDFRAVVNKN